MQQASKLARFLVVPTTTNTIFIATNMPSLTYCAAVLMGLILLECHPSNGLNDVLYTHKGNGSVLESPLPSVQLSHLPRLLTDSCALIGIRPFPSNLDLESILLQLSHAFREEPTVFIGEFNTECSDKIQWKNYYHKEQHLAFYQRDPKDRECLLSLPKTNFYAVPYSGQLNIEVLVQFINEKCGVFRTSRGSLTLEGLFHEHLLRNLYTTPCPVQECLKLDKMPSKMEFFTEYLFRSRPVVIKNAFRDSLAMKKWTSDYFRHLYGNKRIHIKLTNDGVFEGVESSKLWSGYHDNHIPAEVKSQLKFPDLVVVRPATSEMLFSDFLDLISAGNLTYSAYLEYSSIPYYMPELEEDIHELPFLEGQLQRKHLNMWLSDGNTLGKLHFDPFDNFLCQISGEKHLTLFDPHHNENLYESHIPEAILTFDPKTQTFSRNSLLESTSMVMSPVDIKDPDLEKFPNFTKASRVHCVLRPGDVLFMPAFWWHEVQSYPDRKDRRNLAINFWYEPMFTKEFPCEECRLTYNMFYKHLLHEPPV